MGKFYNEVPHAMVRVPHEVLKDNEGNVTGSTPARNVIIDDDTLTVVWTDEDGQYYTGEGTVTTWRNTVHDENAQPVDRSVVEGHVRDNFQEPDLCLEFLAELDN